MNKPSDFEEFVRGQKDYRKGIPHKSQSENYDRGYNFEYALEAILDNRTIKRGDSYDRQS